MAPSFLGVPCEIRITIYEYLFCYKDSIYLYARQSKAIGHNLGSSLSNSLPLLRTCKAVYAEAIPILYGGNTFNFPYGLAWPHWRQAPTNFFPLIGAQNLSLIKNVELELTVFTSALVRLGVTSERFAGYTSAEIEALGVLNISSNMDVFDNLNTQAVAFYEMISTFCRDNGLAKFTFYAVVDDLQFPLNFPPCLVGQFFLLCFINKLVAEAGGIVGENRMVTTEEYEIDLRRLYPEPYGPVEVETSGNTIRFALMADIFRSRKAAAVGDAAGGVIPPP